jgi:CENP-B-like protein
MFTKHGLTNHDLHTRWEKIKARCFNKNATHYEDYGGRGITMCDQWKNDFMSFFNWAITNGYKKELEIDRINNNGDYEPINCRWVTRSQNLSNTRRNVYVELNGERITLTEACNKLGLKFVTIASRMKKLNLSFDEAIVYKKICTTKSRPKLSLNEARKIIELIALGRSERSLAKEYNVHQSTINNIKHRRFYYKQLF